MLILITDSHSLPSFISTSAAEIIIEQTTFYASFNNTFALFLTAGKRAENIFSGGSNSTESLNTFRSRFYFPVQRKWSWETFMQTKTRIEITAQIFNINLTATSSLALVWR